MDEDTKPKPPSSLLPAGHEWRVVEAEYWTAGPGNRCTFDVGINRFDTCGKPSVATEREPKRGRYHRRALGLVPRCGDHLGSIRWVADGKVFAWRAEVCA